MPDQDTFLINPSNARVLGEGLHRLRTLDAGAACGGAFMLPFLIAGAFLLFFTIYQWVHFATLTLSSAETFGKVVDYAIEESDDSVCYRVTSRFVVDDEVYTVSDCVGEDLYGVAAAGDSLRVRYAQVDPNIASLNPNRIMPLLFLTGFTVVWDGIIFLVFGSGLAAFYRLFRLSCRGRLIPGELLECSLEKDRDGDLRLEVKSRFRSPQSGKWIEDSVYRLRNDLAGQSLPAPGTPVHVAYLNDKVYYVL